MFSRRSLALAALAGAVPFAARAQTAGNAAMPRTITMIVPFGPGQGSQRQATATEHRTSSLGMRT